MILPYSRLFFMLYESAWVVEVRQSTVLVQVGTHSSCSHCGVQQSCNNNIWGRLLPAFLRVPSSYLELPNILNVTTGDKIELATTENHLLLTTFVVYLLPIIVLLFSAWIGQVISTQLLLEGELFSIFFAMMGFWGSLKVGIRLLRYYYPCDITMVRKIIDE